jgi:hypothetical protein
MRGINKFAALGAISAQTKQNYPCVTKSNASKPLKASFRATSLSFVFAFVLALNATANLVQDGTFTGVTYSGALPLTTVFGQFGTDTGATPASGSTLTVANWSTGGYNFVYAPGTIDTGTNANGANAGSPNEAPGQFNAANGYGNTYIAGIHNGGVSTITAPPGGGNIVAGDGAYEIGAITQTITGLTVGQTYVLKFEWGGAQQQSFTGATTEAWTVSLGAQNFTTTAVSVPTNGFSGWMQQTFYYKATATTETLSFLAVGTPTGEPPFSLLADVDLEVVPDFSNWMVFAGFGAVCVLFETFRRRRRSSELLPVA